DTYTLLAIRSHPQVAMGLRRKPKRLPRREHPSSNPSSSTNELLAHDHAGDLHQLLAALLTPTRLSSIPPPCFLPCSEQPVRKAQAMRETRQVGGVRRDAVECLRVRSLHARPSSRADGCTGSASPPRDAD